MATLHDRLIVIDGLNVSNFSRSVFEDMRRGGQGYCKDFFRWITHDKGNGRKLVEFGEILNPEGMRTIGDFPNLTAATQRRRWPEARIEKVMGGNWLQPLEDVWGR